MNKNIYQEEINKIRERERKEILHFNHTIAALKKHLNISSTDSAAEFNSGFLLYNHIKDLQIIKQLQGINEHNNIFINVCTYFTELRMARFYSGSTDHYFFGQLNLTKSYPHTLIRPENIEDKIYELLNPIEIDLNMSFIFDWKYFVLSKDEYLLKKILTQDFVKFVARHNDVYIELKGNTCVFRHNLKAISPRVAVRFAEFAVKLQMHL